MSFHVFTMLYSATRILEKNLEQRRLTEVMPGQRWLLNNLYPMRDAADDVESTALCERYGINYREPVEGRNIGLHQGLNRLCELANLGDDDIFAIVDPDGFPLTKGWDKALYDVISEDPKLAYACLWSQSSSGEQRQRDYKVVAGHRVAYQEDAGRFNITAWRWSFVKAVGGFSEPHAFYGGLESEMLGKAKAVGMRHCYLQDFLEDDRLMPLHDELYVRYKWDHAHHQSFKGSFEDYVKEKR